MRVRLSASILGTSVDIDVEDPLNTLDGERSASRMRMLLAEAAEKAYAALYPEMERWAPR